MSAIHLAKSAVSALTRDKPLSSITNWVDILTGPNYDDEAYDGCVQAVYPMDRLDLGVGYPN